MNSILSLFSQGFASVLGCPKPGAKMMDKSLQRNPPLTTAPTTKHADIADNTSNNSETVETPVPNEAQPITTRQPLSLFDKIAKAVRAAHRIAAKVEEVTSSVNNVTQITSAVIDGDEVDAENVLELMETLTKEDGDQGQCHDGAKEPVTMARVFASTFDAASALHSFTEATDHVAEVLDTIDG
jgi:hypothetical protein